jgi:hypothetical protein
MMKGFCSTQCSILLVRRGVRCEFYRSIDVFLAKVDMGLFVVGDTIGDGDVSISGKLRGLFAKGVGCSIEK